MPDTGVEEKSGQRPRRGKLRRRALFGLFTLGLFVCLGVGLTALFASGPVAVPLLGSLLAYQGTRGPVTLSVGRAQVDFTAPDGIDLILEDARATISGGSAVELVLPRLVAPLNGNSLLAGKIHFSALILDRPKVQIELGDGSAPIPGVGPLMEAVDRVSDVVDDQFARRALSKVSIREAQVELTGRLKRNFGQIDADIFRHESRAIRAFAKVSGNVSTWRLELARNAPEGGQQKNIGVVVNGITLAELLGPEVGEKQGKGLRIPASAKIETRLDGDGKFLSTNAVARVQNGWFQLGKTLVAFDDAAMSLVFQRGQDKVNITRSHVIRGNTRIFFTGALEPADGNDSRWLFELEALHPQFGSLDVPEAPIMIDGISMRGAYDVEDKYLNIDSFTAKAGKGAINAVASLAIAPDGPSLALAASGEKIPIALAKQAWPITLVPPARRWIIDNITTGLIESVSYTASIRAPAFNHLDPNPGWSGNDMLVDMVFSRGGVTPIGDVPEVKGLEGTLKVENETLTVQAGNGTAVSAAGGKVTVPETVFRINNLPLRDGKIAEVQAVLEADVSDIGAVVDSAPFKVLERAGLKQGGASGTGVVQLDARFPLNRKLNLTDLDWKASGQLLDFSDSNPVMGQTIANADIALDANPAQVAITGRGVLNGLDADIDLVVPLGESGIAAKQDVIVSVSAEKLKEKGVDLTAFLEGDMTMSVAGAGEAQDFVIDLKEAEVRLEALGWKKSKGVPATATFRLLETAEERRIRDFRLTSEGTSVSGSMRLSLDGDLRTAAFDTFQLRPGDRVEVDIERAPDGRYDIIFAGEAFDGRGLIRSLQSPGGSKGAGDFSSGSRISARVEKVIGFNDQTVQDFSGKIEIGEKGMQTADLSGLVNGRESFKFVVADQNGSQLATGTFADTGATLSFLDLYERMNGGKGALRVVLADEDSWDGEFNVRSLQISEDPAIQKIRRERINRNLQDDSRSRLPEADGSASFDALDLEFTRDGDVLTIVRGALRGSVLGGTVSGDVDLEKGTLNLTGTFVPIYALNNFFSKIPLLGFALGGNSGEGLIGVTYRLTGAVSDPVLSVNPISAIAPGIFRKMFEFQQN